MDPPAAFKGILEIIGERMKSSCISSAGSSGQVVYYLPKPHLDQAQQDGLQRVSGQQHTLKQDQQEQHIKNCYDDNDNEQIDETNE